jgi:hypothetical protein
MSQETIVEQAEPAPPASPRQVALGLFILFQLVFLVVSNFLGFFQWAAPELTGEPKKLANRIASRFAHEDGHGWAWCERLETDTRRWMQLTGQDQDWSLFAPSVSKVTGVPVVLLLWDEPPQAGPSMPGSRLDYTAENGFDLVTAWQKQAPDTVVWLPSDNAPADEKNYIKLGNARLRRYEGIFYLNAQPYKDEPRADAEARMTRRMDKLVTDAHDSIKRYLEWRIRAWQHQHPDEGMPRQAILFLRFYRIHGPVYEGEGEKRTFVCMEEKGWDGPFLVPQARWLAGTQTVEPFNYTEQRFQTMAR